MTQTPKPPQLPQPEPLDEAERAIARALRNLPVGSPPPELDARILGAARRAVHAAPPRRRSGRRWLLGFGTAATALLAIGLVMKTHGPSPDAVFVPPGQDVAASAEDTAAEAKTAMPAPASTPAPATRDVMHTTAEPAPVFAPPSSPAMAARAPAPQKDVAPAATDKPLSNRVGNAPPQAFPAPVMTSTPTPMSVSPPPPAAPPPPLQFEPMAPPPAPAAMAAPQPSSSLGELKKEQSSSDRPRSETQPMTPPPPTGGMVGTIAPAPSDERDAAADNAAMQSAPSANRQAKAKSLDSVEVAASRIRRADAELPPPSADAALNPTAWLERIRERVRRGDRAGAAASLRAFVQANPQAAVPADLQPLLQ
jgi:hypothetical protein